MKNHFRFYAIAAIAMLAMACGKSPQSKVNDTVTTEDIALYDSVWQRPFSNANEIIAQYDSIKSATADDEQGLHTLNQCHYVWNSGEYMFSCRGKNEDINELPKHATELSFDNDVV